MGWTGYYPSIWKNGKVDRKGELDKQFTSESDTRKWEVVKSSMVGSTYYAAIKTSHKDGSVEPCIWGLVCLTKVQGRGWNCEFMYKDMDETMGPYQYECPKSIIKLLSPTDNECALEWRQKCLNFKSPAKQLRNLPVGSQIKLADGRILTKNSPCCQFSKPFWFDGKGYYPKKYIPLNYEIIKIGSSQSSN